MVLICIQQKLWSLNNVIKGFWLKNRQNIPKTKARGADNSFCRCLLLYVTNIFGYITFPIGDMNFS